MSTTSPTVVEGLIVIGSVTTPLSCFFTRETSCAWRSGERFLWTMPMPPSWARAIARRDSVTVSIAAERSGMFSASDRVRRVASATSRGSTREWRGVRRTSSNVSASWETCMTAALRGWLGMRGKYTPRVRGVRRRARYPFAAGERSPGHERAGAERR